MNMQGGCAVEVVSPTSFKPRPCVFESQVGDLGIGCVHQNPGRPCHACPRPRLVGKCDASLSKTPLGEDTFHVRDLDDNLFQILPSTTGSPIRGTLLAASWGVVGVTDIEASFKLYKDIKYDKVLLDETGTFEIGPVCLVETKPTAA